VEEMERKEIRQIERQNKKNRTRKIQKRNKKEGKARANGSLILVDGRKGGAATSSSAWIFSLVLIPFPFID